MSWLMGVRKMVKVYVAKKRKIESRRQDGEDVNGNKGRYLHHSAD